MNKFDWTNIRLFFGQGTRNFQMKYIDVFRITSQYIVIFYTFWSTALLKIEGFFSKHLVFIGSIRLNIFNPMYRIWICSFRSMRGFQSYSYSFPFSHSVPRLTHYFESQNTSRSSKSSGPCTICLHFPLSTDLGTTRSANQTSPPPPTRWFRWSPKMRQWSIPHLLSWTLFVCRFSR